MMLATFWFLLLAEITSALSSSQQPVPFYASRDAPSKSVQNKPPATKDSFFADIIPQKPDLSIPYDAAARFAYDQAGKPGSFVDFKTRYENAMVAMVKSKARARVAVDLRVPYDAAARLAFQSGKSSSDFQSFRVRYENSMIELVKSKKRARAATDLSVPYNAAAQLAFVEAGCPGNFEKFENLYRAESIAIVTKKARRKLEVVSPTGTVRVVSEQVTLPGAAASHDEDLDKTRQLIAFQQDLKQTLEVIGVHLNK